MIPTVYITIAVLNLWNFIGCRLFKIVTDTRLIRKYINNCVSNDVNLIVYSFYIHEVLFDEKPFFFIFEI
jgi:hypothetical protein